MRSGKAARPCAVAGLARSKPSALGGDLHCCSQLRGVPFNTRDNASDRGRSKRSRLDGGGTVSGSERKSGQAFEFMSNKNKAAWGCDRIIGQIKIGADGRKVFVRDDLPEKEFEFQSPPLSQERLRELLNQRALARGEMNTPEYWEARLSEAGQRAQHQYTDLLPSGR
jgi:hypothetical protein